MLPRTIRRYFTLTRPKQHIRLNTVPQFVIQEIDAHQRASQSLTILKSGTFVLLKSLACQMVTLHLPNRHMLIPTDNKPRIFVRVEFKGKNWVVTKISKS